MYTIEGEQTYQKHSGWWCQNEEVEPQTYQSVFFHFQVLENNISCRDKEQTFTESG